MVSERTKLPGGLTVENEDVVRFNRADGTYSLVFDGSDVGLSGFRIDALAATVVSVTLPLPVPVPLPDPVPVPGPVGPPVIVGPGFFFGDLVMSFTKAGTVPGVGHVDDSDLVRFQPALPTIPVPDPAATPTAGMFSLFFDGSDIGLTHSSEDVDAVEIVGDDLYLSTEGSFHADGERGSNEDVFVCHDADTGAHSGCEDVDVVFDGSDAELARSGENVDGFSFTPGPGVPVIPGPPIGILSVDPGAAVFSTNGDFHAGGASGDDDDLFACEDDLDDCEDDPDFDVVFRGGHHGVKGVDIEAIDLVPPLLPIPGGSVIWTITVLTPSAGGPLTNTAVVGLGFQEDSDLSDNAATVTTLATA